MNEIITMAAEPSEAERREAWLAARRQHITATDVAKLLGLSKFGGPTSVYLDKLGEAEVTETERMRWGRRLEAAILAGFAERMNVPVELADPYSLTVCPDEPLIAASLDGRVQPGGAPVDAKNIMRLDPTKWGEELTDQIPDDYALQLAVQMACTGADEAFIAALFGGQQLRVYRVHRDNDVISTAIDAAREFWQRYVVTRTSPPPDGSLAYSEHLSKRLKQTTSLIVDANEEVETWASILKEARGQAMEIGKVIEEAEQNIKEHIGDAAGVKGQGFRIMWRKVGSGYAVDWQAVVNELALSVDGKLLSELIVKHSKPTGGYRRFVPHFED